jgi:exosortase K
MKKIIALGIVGCSFIALKFWYTTASVEAMSFILLPVTIIIEWITSHSSTHQVGEGYLFSNLNIIISKSCSGFNFFLLCTMMLLVHLITTSESTTPKTRVTISLLATSYLSTLLANCSRIVCSLKIEQHKLDILSEALMHTAIGVFTYISFLIATYVLVDHLYFKKLSYADTAPS